MSYSLSQLLPIVEVLKDVNKQFDQAPPAQQAKIVAGLLEKPDELVGLFEQAEAWATKVRQGGVSVETQLDYLRCADKALAFCGRFLSNEDMAKHLRAEGLDCGHVAILRNLGLKQSADIIEIALGGPKSPTQKKEVKGASMDA